MFPITTVYLTHKYWHSTNAPAGYLQIIFHYNNIILQVQISPSNTKHIVVCVYACITTHISGARVHNVAMHSLWEVRNSNIIAHLTIYAQILGASSSFSW